MMPTTTGGGIVARELLWPWGTVEYSQTSVNSPTRHRCDCSGFVSMCLGLPVPGLSTVDLPKHLYRIDWPELQPGDIIGKLGPGTGGDAGHVQVFNGRAGGYYVIAEQSGGPPGPRVNRYSLQTLKGRGYLPYRSKYVGEDDVKLFKTPSSDTIWVSDGIRRRALQSWDLVIALYGDPPPIVTVTDAQLDDAAGPVDQVGEAVAEHHHTTGSPQT